VPVMPSSETVIRSRGRSALDRDGTSLEGASSPRARQNPARRGAQPWSEVEPHPRGRPALERGEVLPVRHCHPRAKRSSARGRQAACLAGRGPVSLSYACCKVRSCFIFYEGKWVSPGCLGDPYGCPR
jgi:hypothetical protein